MANDWTTDPLADTAVDGFSPVDEPTLGNGIPVVAPQSLSPAPVADESAVPKPDQARRRRSPWLAFAQLLTVAALWGLVVVLAHGALATVVGQTLDERAMRLAHAELAPSLSARLRHLLDWLPMVAAVGSAIALMVLAIRTRRLTTPFVGIATAAAALVSVQILKYWVFEKPALGIQEAIVNSFPSGHTTIAATAGMVLVLSVPNRARPWLGVLMALLTTLVGASLVINAWHRPSDVISAVLVTAGWVVLGAMVLYLVDGPGKPRSLASAQVLGFGLGMAVTAVTIGGAFQSWRFAGLWAVWSGLGAILAVCLLCYATIALVMRHR